MSDEPVANEFIAPELEELNQLIPGYEFIDFIAKGGMGAVYLARQVSLDRQVAIKVLPPILCQDEGFKASFETEAKLMAKLNHPNLIGIYDFGDVHGMLYIVMEYVKGQSLFHSSVGKMIEQETAVNIISGVCEGLEHAHEAGMLHRDVKPANILLNKKAVPKIGDFGLARPSEMTETGIIFGTPDYSAPEVLGAPDRVDKRTDIFAVGVMLYELLTSRLPTIPYISVTEFADVDPRFDPIIRRAINPEIGMRYATSSELVEALEEVIKNPQKKNPLLAAGGAAPRQGTTVMMRPASSGAATLKPASQSGVMPMPTLASKKSSAPMVVGILACLVVLGGGFLVINSGEDEERKLAEEKARQEEQARKDAAALEERKKKRLALEAKTAKEKAEREKAAKLAAELNAVSPLDELKSIKEQLADGKRPIAKMPKTIFQRSKDSRILMYIDTPMTWEEADAWAVEYGGYIAVCSELSDLSVFAKNMDSADAVWLGGGNTVNNQWAWIDGTPWSESIALSASTKQELLTLSKEGKIGAQLKEKRLPFFIEWRADGSNPADYKERLARTGVSRKSETPSYPIGTIVKGDRKYYITKSAVSRKQAMDIATQAGGTLLAISHSDEFDFVSKMLSDNTANEATFWTDAVKEDQIWSWQSGESWLKMNWGGGVEDGALAVIENSPKSLLKPVPEKKGQEHKVIIEWSKDTENVKQGKSIVTISQFKDMKKKAGDLIHSTQKKVEQMYLSNISKLVFDLNAVKRRASERGAKAEIRNVSQALDTLEDEARLPANFSNSLKSPKAKGHVINASEAQVRIGDKSEKDLTKIRDSYVARLTKMRDEMDELGQVSMVAHLEKELLEVGESNEDFVKYVQ